MLKGEKGKIRMLIRIKEQKMSTSGSEKHLLGGIVSLSLSSMQREIDNRWWVALMVKGSGLERLLPCLHRCKTIIHRETHKNAKSSDIQ